MANDTQWRPVPGWEGLYETSCEGAVRSLGRWCGARNGRRAWRKGRELKLVAKDERYLAVTLANGAERKQVFVHDVVAAAFIGPKPKGAQVRHLNDDRSDNRAVNLAYGSAAENSDDMARNGRRPRGEAHGMARLRADDVLAIRASRLRAKEVAAQYGIDPAHVHAIKSKRVWKHL